MQKWLLQYKQGSREGTCVSQSFSKVDIRNYSQGSGLNPWVNGIFSEITLAKDHFQGKGNVGHVKVEGQ